MRPARGVAPTARTPFVLALDIGTSSVRAMAFDARAARVAGAQVPYSWTITRDGGVEVSADALVEHAAMAVDQLLAQLGTRANDIAAVGVSTLWHSVMGIDAHGAPSTPLYAWNDVRAGDAAASLAERLDETAVHARTGCMLHSSYLPAKLAWLRVHDASSVARTARWVSIGEYLSLVIGGAGVASYSMASATGLLDQRSLRWDEEVLSAAGAHASQLSELGDLDAADKGLAANWAARWPTLANVPWIPACGDGALANVGSGCTSARDVALSLGTSGAMRVIIDTPYAAPPRGLWRYRLDARWSVIGGAISNGGLVYRWLRDTLLLPDNATLERMLAEAPAGHHELTVLPFLTGERSPDWPHNARAAITGLRMRTTPTEILQAWLEAVALRLAIVYRLLRPVAGPEARVIASGAALRDSPAWASIVADALGVPLTMALDEEASARGAALLALRHIGAIPSLDAIPAGTSGVVQPRAERVQVYDAALERHEALAAALTTR